MHKQGIIISFINEMSSKFTTIISEKEDEGKRLLSFLKSKIDLSKEDLRFAISHNRCKINGHIERFESTKVKAHDRIEIAYEKKPDFSFDVGRILFEDEFLCLYNKLPFIAVEKIHPKFLLAHRLDRDTSGVLLFAKDRKTLKNLEDLFRKREMKKSYLALVSPIPKENKGTIIAPLRKCGFRDGIAKWEVAKSGLYAKTDWEVEKKGSDCALLRCYPETGRTHQIRVHLKSIGHPIIGDIHYGGKESKAFRPLLHAESLSFIHPITQTKMTFHSPLPLELSL